MNRGQVGVCRCIAGLRGVALVLCLHASGLCAGTPVAGVPRLQASEPRAFGWRLGDVVERELVVDLPPGWHLLADSLPTPRANGRALELRSLQRDSTPGQERLQLRYQVMRSPTELRALEIAPLSLQLQGPQRIDTLRVDAWPLLVAPLSPPDALNRRGLGDLQPDRPPPLPTDAARPLRLGAELAVALLAVAGLAHARWGAWWRRRPQRPIAAVARQLRRRRSGPSHGRWPERWLGRLSDGWWGRWRARPGAQAQHQRLAPAWAPAPLPGASALQPSLRAVHAALNTSAGQVLLAQGVPAYCRARPAFVPLQHELLAFFALSDAVFFAATPPPADADAQLRAWLARWARAEQGP